MFSGGSGKRDDTRSRNCAQDVYPALGWRHLGLAPISLTVFAEERARYSGRRPSLTAFPEERARYRVGAHRSQPCKSVHGTRVGAHRSQLFLKSVHDTRVGAHRSQPCLKSVHGTRVGRPSLTACPEERARYSGRRPYRSQPFLKSVHGTRVGAQNAHSLS